MKRLIIAITGGTVVLLGIAMIALPGLLGNPGLHLLTTLRK